MSRELDDETLDALEVIIPNLNWRYSGGTAVNRTIAPLIAKRWRAAWCGPDRPEGIAALTLATLLVCVSVVPRTERSASGTRAAMSRCSRSFLNLFGYGFALIFNSASQRKKTWLTDFLIGRMDAVIATSEAAAQFLRRPATVILHGIDVDLYSPPADRPAAFAETGLPGKYGIGRSAACGGRKAATCSSRRCAGYCRAIPSSARWWSGLRPSTICPLSKGSSSESPRRPHRAHPFPGRIADRGGAALVPADFDLRFCFSGGRVRTYHA